MGGAEKQEGAGGCLGPHWRQELGAAATLAGSTIGAGVVSLPAAFQEAGPPVAATLIVIGVVLTITSLYYAVRAAQLGGANQYGGLCQSMGRAPRVAAELLTLLVLIGVSASLVRLAADSLAGLLPADPSSSFLTPSFLVPVACAVFVLPLSLTQALLWLQHSSIVAIIALMYVVGLLIALGVDGLRNGASTQTAPAGVTVGPGTGAWSSPSLEGALQGLPVMIYALGCQVQAVPVFAELPKAARRPARFALRVAGASVLAAGAAYGFAGTFGVFAFGWMGPMSGDVVSDLPAETSSQAARGMLCVSAMAVLPLLVWPMRRAVAALMLDGGCASRLDEGTDEEEDEEADGEVGAAVGSRCEVEVSMAGSDAVSLLDAPSTPLRASGARDGGAGRASNTPSVVRAGLTPADERRPAASLNHAGHPRAQPPAGLLDLSFELGDEEEGGHVVGGAGVAMGFDASPRVHHPSQPRHHRARSAESVDGPAAGPPAGSCRRRFLEPGLLRRGWMSAVMLTLAVVIALAAPSIKAVFQVVGATGAAIMFFMIPPLALLRLAAWQARTHGPLSEDGAAWPRSARATAVHAVRAPEVSRCEVIGAWIFLATGVVLCIACTSAVIVGLA